jgi:hypothetical protein
MPRDAEVKHPDEAGQVRTIAIAVASAASEAHAGGPIGRSYSSTLDDDVRVQARDGGERVELVRVARLASQRDLDVSMVDDSRNGQPYRLIYYAHRSGVPPTSALNGAIILGARPDIVRFVNACAGIYERENFDMAVIRAPRLEGAPRFWLRLVRRPAAPGLLAIGLVRPMRERLALSETYETFLHRLSRYTRRNIRRARQHAAQEGCIFDFCEGVLPPASLDLVFDLCARNGPRPMPRELIVDWETALLKQRHHFHSTLAMRDGGVISFCRGFLWGDSAVLVYQLNGREHYGFSPSLLHRSYLVERLIQNGVREIIFADGCEGTLRNACEEGFSTSVLVVPWRIASLIKGAVYLMARPGGWYSLLGKTLGK